MLGRGGGRGGRRRGDQGIDRGRRGGRALATLSTPSRLFLGLFLRFRHADVDGRREGDRPVVQKSKHFPQRRAHHLPRERPGQQVQAVVRDPVRGRHGLGGGVAGRRGLRGSPRRRLARRPLLPLKHLDARGRHLEPAAACRVSG